MKIVGTEQTVRMDHSELLGAVDAAFVGSSLGLEPWLNPHPHGESPAEDEYSRVSDPSKFLLIGARFEAWVDVLVSAGVARIERAIDVEWLEEPTTVIGQTDRLSPMVKDGLQVVAARSRVGNLEGAGLTFGAGHPATILGWLPYCGCDACDSGSEYELETLDEWMASIVLGTFRHLSRGEQSLTVTTGDGWSGSMLESIEAGERVLANPADWNEVAGAAWFGGPPPGGK